LFKQKWTYKQSSHLEGPLIPVKWPDPALTESFSQPSPDTAMLPSYSTVNKSQQMVINPLTTNDAYMSHGPCELSI